MEFHFGELFPRMGFIVTNLETDSRAAVRFYYKRGTAEIAAATIKEGKLGVRRTAASGLAILQRGKTDSFRGPWKHPALKTRLDIPFRGGRVHVTGRPEIENGSSGQFS